VTIAVLDYGSGNLRSVSHALARVGADVEVTGEHDRVLAAHALVVPGVGHFGACMQALRERGLDATIKDVIGSGRPVFGVCVGMQILFEGSEEAPGVAGLGVFEDVLRRLPDVVKVPHLGWNVVTWRAAHPYTADVPDTWFSFAHSFGRSAEAPDVVGTVSYGMPLAAAVARANVFATQFHPERSGAWGLRLYEAFVRDAER
jgi:imidazole glycerol-phosphate synthase subunit HisH